MLCFHIWTNGWSVIKFGQISSEITRNCSYQADNGSKASRISTKKVYVIKRNNFSSWFRRRAIDPVMASAENVANFLLHMFQEKKCQVSTVKGYISAILNTLKSKSGQNIG